MACGSFPLNIAWCWDTFIDNPRRYTLFFLSVLLYHLSFPKFLIPKHFFISNLICSVRMLSCFFYRSSIGFPTFGADTSIYQFILISSQPHFFVSSFGVMVRSFCRLLEFLFILLFLDCPAHLSHLKTHCFQLCCVHYVNVPWLSKS